MSDIEHFLNHCPTCHIELWPIDDFHRVCIGCGGVTRIRFGPIEDTLLAQVEEVLDAFKVAHAYLEAHNVEIYDQERYAEVKRLIAQLKDIRTRLIEVRAGEQKDIDECEKIFSLE